MRPINKGESPYKKINEYKDALPYLERRIGMYCSYCEFSIPHVPEVEHVVSKSKGGDLTDWNNLNLGCKYCNTRKRHRQCRKNKKTICGQMRIYCYRIFVQLWYPKVK